MKQIISPEQLQIKIKILAKQLSDDHKDDKTPVVAVCILNGGFMFFTDFSKSKNRKNCPKPSKKGEKTRKFAKKSEIHGF